MLKFMSGIAIIAFTTFCGYLLAKKYRQRKLFFAQLNEFNQRFLHEISYLRRPIGDFMANFSYKGEFNDLLEDFYTNLQEGRENGRSAYDFSRFLFLSMEERRTLEDYFLILGKGDSTSQKGYFNSVKDRLSTLQIDSEVACKRYGDLYIKLGFLCGLLFLLLII